MVARPEDLFWNDEADFKIRRTVQGIDVTSDKVCLPVYLTSWSIFIDIVQLVRAGFYLTNEQKKIMSASAGVKTECLLSVNLVEVFENRTRVVDAMLSQSRYVQSKRNLERDPRNTDWDLNCSSRWRDVDCDHCAATPGPFKVSNLLTLFPSRKECTLIEPIVLQRRPRPRLRKLPACWHCLYHNPEGVESLGSRFRACTK